MGKAGSPVCRYVDYKCYIWLDAEEREESSDTKIIISSKLLMQSVSTQCEQTIVHEETETHY